MAYLKNLKPELTERVVSALSYPSCGIIGLIYLLLSGKHARTAPFFYFHFLQSIILGILSFLLGFAGMVLKNILIGAITLVFALLPGSQSIAVAVGTAIDGLLLLINGLIYLLLIYGLIFALLGKYAEIPVISSLVRKNIR